MSSGDHPGWVQTKILESYPSFGYKKSPSGVLTIDLNRAKTLNSQDYNFFKDFAHFFKYINFENDVRVIVITSSVKHFCVGIDFGFVTSWMLPAVDIHSTEKDQARKSLDFEQKAKELQRPYTNMEKCRFPILCGVHGLCIGAGVDFITACDMVFCEKNSRFSIKEIDLGIVSDIGS
jgi:enoyl-CoA hydratase/carnithine racemase